MMGVMASGDAPRGALGRWSTRRARTTLLVLAVLGPAVLGACGDDDDDTAQAAPAATSAAPVTTSSSSTTTTTTTTLPPTTTSTSTTTSTTTTTTTTTTSTTTTPATTVLPAFTEPIAPPADTRGREPVIELGTISIPKIGVSMVMYEGLRMTTLDRGPGHWPGTALPGQGGNVVVAGHRTSKHKVFRNVDQLTAGDEIIFDDANGHHVYRVTGIEIVQPDAVWIVNPTATPTATLFACHPPGSTRQRIVVFADLVQG
jgi:sortase A